MTRQVREERWSLDACVGYARQQNLFRSEQIPCTKTLYNILWHEKEFIYTAGVQKFQGIWSSRGLTQKIKIGASGEKSLPPLFSAFCLQVKTIDEEVLPCQRNCIPIQSPMFIFVSAGRNGRTHSRKLVSKSVRSISIAKGATAALAFPISYTRHKMLQAKRSKKVKRCLTICTVSSII